MKNINFIINGYPRLPTGGLIIINKHFEYINANFKVTFIDFSARLNGIKYLKNKFRFLLAFLFNERPSWLNKKCKVGYKVNVRQALCKECINICTTIDQALALLKNPNISSYRLIYFAQHWEFWEANESELNEVWSSEKITKITCSKWLCEYSISKGAKKTYDSVNGIYDYKPTSTTSLVARKIDVLVMLSKVPWKRSNLSIESTHYLSHLFRENGRDLNIKFFSLTDGWDNLPKGSELIVNPSKEEINDLYANSKIFIVSSVLEGFCLPAAESMSHGCILVSSDCGGVNDFLKNGYNGYIVRDFTAKNVCDFVYEKLENIKSLGSISSNARDTFDNYYAFSVSSNRFQKILEKVIK